MSRAPLQAPAPRAAKAGFTLIELLGVVGIIAILLGIVLSAIETVHRYSRKAVAQVEVRTIEDAWKRYFDHYNRWPTNEAPEFLVATNSQAGVYLTYRITPSVSLALEGRIDTPLARELNPEGVHFIEFTRYGSDSTHARLPVNPWYHGETLNPDGSGRSVFYYVRFDVNANNQVSLKGLLPAPNADKLTEEYVNRSVIVWTYNPDDPEFLIGSWTR